MNKKGLTSLSDSKPQLAQLYEDVHKTLYDVNAFVPKMYWDKFRKLEKKLLDEDIIFRDYAYTVIAFLRDWLETKGFKTVPFNVFCGKWAYDGYMEVHDSETVVIYSDDDEYRELLYTELLVSKVYIEKNCANGAVAKFSDVVEELKPILDPLWVSLYETGAVRLQSLDVLEILEEEYMVSALSLSDIVTQLVLSR